MRTKTIRIPDKLENGLRLVQEKEHVEEATAIRKVMRIGLVAYVANLYRRGEITLREAAERLDMSLSETLDAFLDLGVKGNLGAAEVLAAIEAFGE